MNTSGSSRNLLEEVVEDEFPEVPNLLPLTPMLSDSKGIHYLPYLLEGKKKRNEN